MSNAPDGTDVATATPAAEQPVDKKKEWAKAGGLGLAIALIGCLFAIMFLWPMTTTNPKDIKLGVVAPEAVKAQLAKQLEAKDKDLFDFKNTPPPPTPRRPSGSARSPVPSWSRPTAPSRC
jgi:hypothetical protein